MLNIKNIIKIFSEYNRQYLWENCLPKMLLLMQLTKY